MVKTYLENENLKLKSMKIRLIAILISITTGLFGQTWIKTFDHNNGNTDVASKIIETHHHHFIVSGSTTIPSIYSWGFNGYIIALDYNGDTLWTKEMGSTANDFLTDVIENTNHELIFTGMRFYYNYFSNDNSQQLWILKMQLNSSGDQITNISEKYVGGKTQKDGGTKIIQNPDGTYFVTGVTESYGTQQGGEDAWLLKLDTNLDTLWTRTYDFGYKEEAKTIIPFNSYSYLLVVNSTTGQMGFPPYYCTFSKILQIDASGNILKTLTFDNDTINFISNARPTSDGGAVLIGSTGKNDNSYTGGGRNIFVVKLNANADTVWTKIYGNYGKYDGGFDIIQDNDETYYAVCYTQTQYVDSVDNWYLMRLDNNGNMMYSSCLIHKKDNDDPQSILKASDGTLVIAGHINANSDPTQGLDLGNANICIAKIDTNFTTNIFSNSIVTNNTKIFPNPFNGKIPLQINVQLNDANIELFDSFGKVIYRKNHLSGNNLNIPQYIFSSGVYMIRIFQNNQIIFNDKLVVIE